MKKTTAPRATQGMLSLAVLLLAFATVGHGETSVTLTASDGSTLSSFNTAGNWSNAAAPMMGDAYSTGANAIRTPISSTSYTFGGDSLTINGGNGYLYVQGTSTGTYTINNNTGSPGGLIVAASGSKISNASSGATIAGLLTLNGSLSVGSTAPASTLTLNSTVVGSGGSLTFGVGNYTFSGTGNTYSGGTFVADYSMGSTNTGTLTVSSGTTLGTGAVYVSGIALDALNTLNLTSNTNIAATSALYLGAAMGATNYIVNLNFSGIDNVSSIQFNGGTNYSTSMYSGDTFGAIGSGATFTSANFTGTGLLGLNAVPEPSTWALMFGGLAFLGLASRRKFCRA